MKYFPTRGILTSGSAPSPAELIKLTCLSFLVVAQQAPQDMKEEGWIPAVLSLVSLFAKMRNEERMHPFFDLRTLRIHHTFPDFNISSIQLYLLNK